MPLTPAHAAAVVPFSRWKPYFWLSPLAVGSMSPDFLYFAFPPAGYRHLGHTPLGIVLFCLPAGLAVLYAFHRFVKRPLVLLLPQPARAKLWPYCRRFPLLPLRRLAWISLLIFFGAVTHVVWDGLTHEDGWALRDCPQILAANFTIAGHLLHGVGLLQYGSSVLGLGLLAGWSWQWYRSTPPGRAPADPVFLRRTRPAIATAIVVFGIMVGTLRGLNYACHLPGPFNTREFCAAAFLSGSDAFALALLVFVAAVNLRIGGAARKP
jgi:hypothetical protein